MPTAFFLFVFFPFAGLISLSAQEFCVQGRVSEASGESPVEGVHVWDAVREMGAVTDSSGFFELCGAAREEFPGAPLSPARPDGHAHDEKRTF